MNIQQIRHNCNLIVSVVNEFHDNINDPDLTQKDVVEMTAQIDQYKNLILLHSVEGGKS